MAKALAHFAIEPAGVSHLLSIEDGRQIDLTPTMGQPDFIAEAVGEHLEGDFESVNDAKTYW